MEARLMEIDSILRTVQRLFLDTAPIIYYVENHPRYVETMERVFEALDVGRLQAITSPVTLAECLVAPIRDGDIALQQDYIHTAARSPNATLVPSDEEIAVLASELRARYGLSLPDAFQLSTAIRARCDAFLTNDLAFQRVTETRVLLLDELVSS